MEKKTKRQEELIRKASVLSHHAEKMYSLGDYVLADAMNGKAKSLLRRSYMMKNIERIEQIKGRP